MNRKRRRTGIIVVFIALAAVLAGATTYLVFTNIGGRRAAAAQIDALLAEADYEISLGYHDKALESLDRALVQARGEYSNLRILKRVYQISYELDDFSILNRFARRSVESIPGSRELTEIYLYSSIRSEISPKALSQLKRSGEKLPGLQAEAYLRGALDFPPESEADPRLQDILALHPGPDAADQDPGRLQRLGTDLDEPRIVLDAALLLMGQGETESAFSLVKRHIGDPLFREPGIYIAYDAGHDAAALSLIEQHEQETGSGERVDLQIMGADLSRILGDQARAQRLYRHVIDSHPGYSWTPYLNLALASEQEGDTRNAHIYRDGAYRYFPDVGSVVVSYARSLNRLGDEVGAAEVLEDYLVGHGEDYQARLLLLEIRNTASSPAVYRAELWKLYNRNPESRMLCEHLFLYLLEFNDLSGAESALRHYELATGRSREPWFLDYRAVLAALHQDYGQAAGLLRDRLVLEDSWQARVNLAVLLGKARQSRQAIEQLIEAENLLPDERRQYFQSRIRSRIGEQYLLLGDAASARRECEYAIDLDVSNFHAHRILRILERQ